MIVTCVYVYVKPEMLSRFITLTTENHNETVKEPGNLRFDMIQQADDPCRFMLYEAFESEAAAAEHKRTEHYLKWREGVNEMMAEPRKGVKYNIIQPNDILKW
jgi:(4S)-4-hydroxy-5-phosphonooxypentane-2,3-dione isomerase